MPPESVPLTCTVAVIGGGPSGLALATALRQRGVKDVLVLEREAQAGGVPRHCGHYPFGVREFRSLMRGPDYADRLRRDALSAGVRVLTGVTVTALHPGGHLDIVTDQGPGTLTAQRVALCTGAREASRAQRFLGGDRVQGVIPTGTLQDMVYLKGQHPFRRPVILGTELVSYSALLTCRHAGIRPAAMIETGPRPTARPFARGLPWALGIPQIFDVAEIRIHGQRTVEGVSFTRHGQRTRIDADGVIVTGRFRPEAALLHRSHIAIDPATGGPEIDQFGRTSDPACFAAGNLLRPIETAAWCWHEGHQAAARIAADLDAPIAPPADRQVITGGALRFAVPQRLAPIAHPLAMENLQLRFATPAEGYLTARSGGATLACDWMAGRPERRKLWPLAPLLRGHGTIEMTIGEA